MSITETPSEPKTELKREDLPMRAHVQSAREGEASLNAHNSPENTSHPNYSRLESDPEELSPLSTGSCLLYTSPSPRD